MSDSHIHTHPLILLLQFLINYIQTHEVFSLNWKYSIKIVSSDLCVTLSQDKISVKVMMTRFEFVTCIDEHSHGPNNDIKQFQIKIGRKINVCSIFAWIINDLIKSSIWKWYNMALFGIIHWNQIEDACYILCVCGLDDIKFCLLIFIL